MTHSNQARTLTREQLSARLDTLETKAIRLDRYANQDTNSMQHLRALETERNAAKEVILAHDAALRALSSPAPVEANGCPSCAAVGATWIGDCDNPIHIHQANSYIHMLEDRLASLSPAPVWSSKKPTVPGFYWFKSAAYSGGVVRVTGSAVHFCSGLTISREEIKGEWSGPLEVPK